MAGGYSASDVRTQWADILNRVHYKGERITITKHEKGVAALVPIEDLEILEAIEDAVDIEDARKSLHETKKKGTIPWLTIRKELNL